MKYKYRVLSTEYRTQYDTPPTIAANPHPIYHIISFFRVFFILFYSLGSHFDIHVACFWLFKFLASGNCFWFLWGVRGGEKEESSHFPYFFRFSYFVFGFAFILCGKGTFGSLFILIYISFFLFFPLICIGYRPDKSFSTDYCAMGVFLALIPCEHLQKGFPCWVEFLCNPNVVDTFFYCFSKFAQIHAWISETI